MEGELYQVQVLIDGAWKLVTDYDGEYICEGIEVAKLYMIHSAAEAKRMHKPELQYRIVQNGTKEWMNQ